MKNRLNVRFLMTLSIILFAGAFALFSQERRTATDGDPQFHDFRTGFNPNHFVIDTLADGNQVLEMRPIHADTTFTPQTTWKLDGIKWQFDNSSGILRHAADVDDISAFSDKPRYLITDLSTNKIIVTTATNIVTWEYAPNPSLYATPYDADFFQEDVNGVTTDYILVSFKGTNVVTKVDYDFQVVDWEYGHPSTAGNLPGYLNAPNDAEKIPNSDEIIIADTGNKRVIVVNEITNNIMWEYSFTDLDNNFSPSDIEYIAEGFPTPQVLITDQTGQRVLLVDYTTRQITWIFGENGSGSGATQLSSPADADWVPQTGHIIIADKGNNRILEVSPTDSTYFFTWPNPSNSIEDVDAVGNDGFLVCQRELVNGQDYWLPRLLQFEAQETEYVSQVIDLGYPSRFVDFERLFWHLADSSTSHLVRFQFRSSDGTISPNDPWFGPDGTPNTYYRNSGDTLNSRHNVHFYFQVKAILQTDNPRVTPQIDSLTVSYKYYDTDQRPFVYSNLNYTIGAPVDTTVTVYWDSLTLFWKPTDEELPYLPYLQFIVSINNADEPDSVLWLQGPTSVLPTPMKFPLANEISLRGVERIGIVISFISYRSALTPRLDKWRVTWIEVNAGPPSIQFVNVEGEPKEFYTAASFIPLPQDSLFADSIYVLLDNVLESTDALSMQVLSDGSLDEETVSAVLEQQGARNRYITRQGLPAIIVTSPDSVVRNNGTVEIYDRDQLSVEFASISRPSEIIRDSILVVEGMLGQLLVENAQQQSITVSQLDQRVYARVIGERDRSLSFVLQDTIQVTFFNPGTNDEENLNLYETTGNTGQYDSGEFTSQNGIFLRNGLNYTLNDGILFARPNDVIQVEYQDNFRKTPTRIYVSIPDTIGIQMARALSCEVAPNPFYSNRGVPFRMRLGSSLGAMTVEKLEIYNLAGERVAEKSSEDLVFADWGSNVAPRNQYGILNNWWNLENNSGDPISSGTYWVKIYAQVLNQSTNVSEKMNVLTKFVVIR